MSGTPQDNPRDSQSQYFDLLLHEAKKKYNRKQTLAELQEGTDWGDMDNVEKYKFLKKYTKEKLQKKVQRYKDSMKTVTDMQQREKLRRKLLPKVGTYKKKPYARTANSRQHTFIPQWAEKFTQRPVASGDVDAIYLIAMFLAALENGDTTVHNTDWFYLGMAVHNQIEHRSGKVLPEGIVNILTDKVMADLIFNGKKPPKRFEARTTMYQYLLIFDDEDQKETTEFEDDIEEAQMILDYIKTITDSALDDMVQGLYGEDMQKNDDVNEEDLMGYVLSSDDFTSYLIKNAKRDRRFLWMKDITELEGVRQKYLKHFLYIATILMKSGWKFHQDIKAFIEKHGGETTSCIDTSENGYPNLQSRAIRFLTHFDIVEQIMNGQVQKYRFGPYVRNNLNDLQIPTLHTCDVDYLKWLGSLTKRTNLLTAEESEESKRDEVDEVENSDGGDEESKRDEVLSSSPNSDREFPVNYMQRMRNALNFTSTTTPNK